MAEPYYKNRLKDIAFILNSDNTFSSYVDGIVCWLEASGFAYRYSNTDNLQILVIQFDMVQFDMGRNWSLFFKTYMQSVLEYYNITNT